MIRTQPTEASLCTLEAVSLALHYLGEEAELHEKLRKPLQKLCEIQIAFGAETHKSVQYRFIKKPKYGQNIAEIWPKYGQKKYSQNTVKTCPKYSKNNLQSVCLEISE